METVEKELEKISIKKRIVSIVFIGHVDAGKSTTGGQILYLADRVDKRTLEKYEKESKEKNRESWYLSWALDSNPEEREKGKTTEVGHAFFDLPSCTVQILDAPGHKMYVPNMIQGVTQADIAVLVISARQNEFEAGFEKGGQTREHIYLAKAAGIQKICILVNKMDDPTVDWSEARYNQIVTSTKKMLTALFGKENITYIPVSGFLGYNIKDPLSKSICPWYKGITFFNYLEDLNIIRHPEYPMFSNVTDVMKEIGGYYIYLRVEQGILEKNTVKVHPGEYKQTVIQILKEEIEVEKAYPGECVKIKLKEAEDIQAGDMICSPEYNEIKDSNYFMAHLSLLETKSLVTKGYTAVMHMGARTAPVTIGEMYKKENDKIHKVKYAKAGDKVTAEIFTNSPICLQIYAPEKRAGIFTLRDETRTVGFGKVLKVKEKK
ncbi:peptide chain release factor subunit 3 [Nematocida sp. AWRm80]|nr:peptide chain release factor subunit 3 [Nematocida sp. AWRm80]